MVVDSVQHGLYVEGEFNISTHLCEALKGLETGVFTIWCLFFPTWSFLLLPWTPSWGHDHKVESDECIILSQESVPAQTTSNDSLFFWEVFLLNHLHYLLLAYPLLTKAKWYVWSIHPSSGTSKYHCWCCSTWLDLQSQVIKILGILCIG